MANWLPLLLRLLLLNVTHTVDCIMGNGSSQDTLPFAHLWGDVDYIARGDAQVIGIRNGQLNEMFAHGEAA